VSNYFAHARLAASGPPRALRDPAQVGLRVARALVPRPRLALDSRDPAIVADWLAEIVADVAAAAPRLLEETFERLPQR
jgi:hypothetical protein